MAEAIKIYSSGEVAQIFGVTAETVRWWVRTERLKAWKTQSGLHIFTASEVERLKAKRAKR